MIRSERSHLQVVASSHPGMSGKNNEDRYAVSAYRLGLEDPTPAVFAVLCDGIGGHRAGEVAAEMAVESISQRIAESDGSHPVEALREAIQLSSERIYAHAQQDPAQQGMGSTCACAWVIEDRVYTATIGDSRIYLVRGRHIQQVSKDHTWLQEALDNGTVKPEEARGHPNAHVIRRFLGSSTPPQVDFRIHLKPGESDRQAEANQGFRLQPGDQVLLCSDGLSDLVREEEMLTALRNYPFAEVGQALIALANARGGHDNITLIALRRPLAAEAAEPTPTRQESRPRRSLLAVGCLGILLVGLLAAAVYLSLNGIKLGFGPTVTPGPTLTLPAALLTALPGEQTDTPFPTPTAGLLTPTVQPGGSGGAAPTYTPWPTNTSGPIVPSLPPTP